MVSRKLRYLFALKSKKGTLKKGVKRVHIKE